MDSENIQCEDVIKLVLQFCKEHGLQKTASALAEEADSQTNFIKDHQKFQAAFRSGQWDFILTEIEGMVLPRELLMDLFEQVIFELCELGEYDLARHIVKLLVQKRLNEEFQDRYFVISEIVDSKKFNASSYYQKESKQEKRDKLYKRTVSEISQAKPGRLVFLLSHGLRRLREERKQVAGEKYNIFEDEFIPFADIADQPPNRIAKTVKLPAESKPTSQVYSSNGRHLFIGTSDGFVEVWSPMTRTLAADIKYQADEVFIMHDHSITALCPTKDSDFLAVADSSRKINIWKVEKGNILLSLSDTHKGTVGVMAFTEEEDHIITAASDIKVWGLKSGRKVNEMSGHDGSVTVLRIFEGLIMSGGSEGSIKVWNMKSGKEKLRINPFEDQPHKGMAICGLELLAEEKILVCSEGGGYVQMNYEGKVTSRAKIDEKEVDLIDIGVSPKQQYCYLVSKQGYLYIYGLKNNKLEGFSKVTQSKPISMISHPNKNMITILTDNSELLFIAP